MFASPLWLYVNLDTFLSSFSKTRVYPRPVLKTENAREVPVKGMAELNNRCNRCRDRGAIADRDARRAARDSRESGRWDGRRSIVPRDGLKGRRGARYTSVRERSAIMQSRSTRLCCRTIR